MTSEARNLTRKKTSIDWSTDYGLATFVQSESLFHKIVNLREKWPPSKRDSVYIEKRQRFYGILQRLLESAMDVLILISGVLFFAADVFAVASLANPEWVVSDDASKLTFFFFFFYCHDMTISSSELCLFASLCHDISGKSLCLS